MVVNTSGVAVIQLTVAVAEPVVPSVFWNVKVNDPFPVNTYVLLPLLLVIVTPVVENPVSVAVTVPVVLVAGLYTIFPVRAITSVGSSHASSGTHSLSSLSSCHAGIVSWIPSMLEQRSIGSDSGTQLLFSSSISNPAAQTQSAFSFTS